MLRLRMLGGLAIEVAAEQRTQAAPDTCEPPLNGAAVQRRPLALLAFLATAGESGRSRDDVLLHLWPDSTPVRARNVLKQTLYALRRDLRAPELVLGHGDRLRTNPALLTSDVAGFEAALDGGEIEPALALYRGPFLDGFSLAEVPEFERWAEKERERLAARADAARRSVEGAHPSGRRVEVSSGPAHALRWSTTTRRLVFGGIAAAVALTSLGVLRAERLMRASTPAGAAVDARVIAVLPFDAAGADSSLTFLGRGMVDLLTAELTGDRDGGPRAIDPRVALSAWQHVTSDAGVGPSPTLAARAAERLGAGRVVVGSVIGTATHLVLTADLLAVPSGVSVAQASVVGVADSLPILVDRLVATLLLDADRTVGPAGRSVLGTTPLSAVRDYVEGQAAYRLGDYDEAVRRFSRALAADSTFALAALGLARSVGWAGAMLPVIDRAARLAWTYRDRLSPHERLALLASLGGPEALSRGFTPETTKVAAWERAADANPDDPEMWYQVGDRYLHLGSLIGMPAPLQRALAAFRRAATLDPEYAPAVVHLVQVAARLGDTATVRLFGTQLLRHDSTSESAAIIRWRMAVAFGDSAALRTLRARFDELPLGALHTILATAECDALDLGDADRALAVMLRRSATTQERAFALLHAHAYALNRGRWADALHATEMLRDAEPAPRWHLRIRVLDALYAGGDSAAARASVDTLRRFAGAPLAASAAARYPQYEDISVVTQWELWHGDRRGLPRALERLSTEAHAPDSLRRVVANSIATALLRAIAANTGVERDLPAIDRLDALLGSESNASDSWPSLYPNLAAARLYARHGRPDRALTAARRRSHYFPETMYLTPSLALEARLATQLGDTAGADAARRKVRALWGSARADAFANDPL